MILNHNNKMNPTENLTQTLPSVIYPKNAFTYRTHKCQRCNLGFKCINDLRNHLFTKADDDHICPECGQYFESKTGMKKHFGKLHSKIRTSKCNICTKGFSNKYALKLHVQQFHEESSRVTCPECNIEYYNIYSLMRHYKDKHNKNEEDFTR